MSSHSLADITQDDWIRGCRKLGLVVETQHGKGSHALVKHPTNNSKYTIQRKLHKMINKRIFAVMEQWGFKEEEIWDALR